MKIDWRKMNYVEKEDGEYLDVYYDVTKLFKELPSCVESIQVLLLENVYAAIRGNTEWLEKRFSYAFSDHVVSDGTLHFDDATAIITFKDGYQLKTWNSEWGGLEFVRPE